MATAPPLTPSRTISAPRPGPMEQRLLQRIGDDIRRERRVRRRAELPPGSLAPSCVEHSARSSPTRSSLLLEHERRYGPVFTIRLLHEPIVWAIGAEVNHQILVSDFDAFQWREGRFADLWPLLGDGLLNVDGPYHRDFRMLMLPAFHRDYIAALAETMVEEALAAAERLEDGRVVEIYHWVRELALRIALRGLLGLDATDGREQALAARSRRRWPSTASRCSSSCCRCPARRWRGPSPPAARSTRWCARRSRSAGAGATRAAACSGCSCPPPTKPDRRCPPASFAIRP